MGKKLAIRGHSTRGKEVIELLEMMGGHATIINCNEIYNKTDKSFFISDNENCFYRKSIRFIPDSSKEMEEFNIFTLEEFLEKYPFKVGDKVRDDHGDALTIKSMWWHDELETMVYDFEDSDIVLTLECLLKYNNPIHKRTHEDVIFDSIIWHLRNSVNNGKQNLSGGECEDYFREVVKKIMKTK